MTVFYNSTLRQWCLFHQGSLLGKLNWMGIPILKNPIDLAMYWEILWEKKPDTIVEVGSMYGGSALFFATLLDTFSGNGKVITIDIDHSKFRADYPSIYKITGDSASPEVFERATDLCEGRVMVVHDGAHDAEQVYKDLCLYGQLVSPGQYLVVEDTIIDEFQPGDSIGTTCAGPGEAARKFLATHPEFIADLHRERYFLTYNRGGWLLKVR